MQKLMKRSAALLMALVILISLVPAVALPTQAATYVYNWGTREDVATKDDFTRSTAEEWYAAQNTSYAELAQYTGSANNSSVPSSTLYQKLRSLMRGAVTDTNSYEDVKNLCKYTDCQNGGGKISSFYSGTAIGPAWNSSEWNREHTWPNSKGDSNGNGENDIFMVRPTSIKENSSRGNLAYGESSGFYNPNKESGGKYDLRGDVVRIMLFVYVRWQNISSGGGVLFGDKGVLENRAIMLKWLEEDPVDTWELGRNDSCQSITGTRNVFVDYPELAFKLFGAEVPANYQTPSGGASTPTYTVTATSNNTNYGTVSVSGKTITATPKDGYFAAGYTVTNGTATVTQNGNTFTVSPSSNCTVRINFEAKKTVTVSFAGATVSAETGFAGETMTLPTVTAPEGYTFLGWMSSPVTTDTTTKPNYFTSFAPTANTTLYALYSYKVEGESGSGDYVKVTSAPTSWAGEYLIVYESKKLILKSSQSSLGDSGNYVSVTITNNTISAEQGDPYKVTIAEMSGGYSIQAASGQYMGGKSGSNAINTSTTALKNTLSIDASGNVDIVSETSHLRYNDSAGVFRYYKSSSYTGQKAIALYAKQGFGSVTYYTGNPGLCQHLNAYYVDIQEPTCTEAGFFDGTYCPDCEEFISGGEKIPALGHEESAQVIAPTLTQGGYTLYLCPACGEEQGRGSATAALTNVEGWQLVLDNKLVVSFRLYLSKTIVNTANVKITVGDETTTYTVSDLTQEGADIYCVDVPVSAAQMNDNIGIQVVNGSDVTPVKNYTVRQYCDTLLANAQYTQYHALVKEMLHYGAMAQAYFGHNTGAPANQGITGTAAADLPETAPELVVADESDCLNFYGATLVYREKIAIRYYFTGDVTDCTFTANGQTLALVERAGEYYVEFSDILPQDLDQSITVTVTDGEGNVLSVTYGAMNYMVRMSQQENANLQALLKALYNYHLAAKAVG